MFKSSTLHAWFNIILAMAVAGMGAAVVSFPQYAPVLSVIGAALVALNGKITQSARNAEAPEKTPPSPPTVAGLLLFVFFLSGCSSFMHFSDPTLEDIAAKICGEAVEQHRAELQAKADKAGIPLADLINIFQVACVLRIKQGGQDAPSVGMSAVRMRLNQ